MSLLDVMRKAKTTLGAGLVGLSMFAGSAFASQAPQHSTDRVTSDKPSYEYQVEKGDTLGEISGRFCGDKRKYGEIAELNNINPNVIHVGQKLQLPQSCPISSPSSQSNSIGTSYKVKSGDTLYSIATSRGLDYHEVAKFNDIHPDKLFVGQELRFPQKVFSPSQDISQVSSDTSKKLSSPKFKEDNLDENSLKIKQTVAPFNFSTPGLAFSSPVLEDLLSFEKKRGESETFSFSREVVTEDDGEVLPDRAFLDRTGKTYEVYKVKPGDSLSKLAAKFDLTPFEEKEFYAQVTNKNMLRVGQELKVPLKGFIEEGVLQTYAREKYDENLLLALKKTHSQILEDKARLGKQGMAKYLGYTPGVAAHGKRSLDALLLQYDYISQASSQLDFKRYYGNRADSEELYTLLALTKVESGGDCRVGSPTGALGCSQLVSEIVEEYGVNPFRSSQVYEASAHLLNEEISKFGLVLGITAYNAGAPKVQEAYSRAEELGMNLSDKSSILTVKDAGGNYVLDREARNYYRKVLREKQKLKEKNIFSPQNEHLREERIYALLSSNSVLTVKLPQGKLERHLSKEYDYSKVDLYQDFHRQFAYTGEF